MVQVDFSDEERIRRESAVGNGTARGLAGWFITRGFAQNEKEANQVLVIVLIGVLVLTAILAWKALRNF